MWQLLSGFTRTRMSTQRFSNNSFIKATASCCHLPPTCRVYIVNPSRSAAPFNNMFMITTSVFSLHGMLTREYTQHPHRVDTVQLTGHTELRDIITQQHRVHMHHRNVLHEAAVHILNLMTQKPNTCNMTNCTSVWLVLTVAYKHYQGFSYQIIDVEWQKTIPFRILYLFLGCFWPYCW